MGEYEVKYYSKPVESVCQGADCEMICGNNIDIDVTSQDCEIHADVLVKKLPPSVRLWGQIKDCQGKPMSNCLLKLVKVVEKCEKMEYYGVAHTISDCDGFYQFEVPKHHYPCRYKIIVNKSAKGQERKIDDAGSCACCEKEPCCCED